MAIGTTYGSFTTKVIEQLDALILFAKNEGSAPSVTTLLEKLPEATSGESESSIELSQASTLGSGYIITKAYDSMTVVSRQLEILGLTRDSYFESAEEELIKIKEFYQDQNATISSVATTVEQSVDNLSSVDDPYLDELNNIVFPGLE